MSNQNYILRTQGFNAISGVTEGQDIKLRSTVGELGTEGFEGVNYKIRAGFEGVNSALPFSIRLSTNLIDFGLLSPTNPIIRTLNLGINSESAYGYSILAFEDKPLTSTPSGKNFIPDTTCDNGQCDSQSSSEWSNTLTYGFGYRCDNVNGLDCDKSFKKTNFYKPFAGIDNPQPVMSGIGANNKETQISYKANISGSQANDIYNNTITFIAIPNF